MRYCITINNKLKEEFLTLEEAKLKQQKHLEKIDKQQVNIKSNVKFKKPTVKIIIIPNISIGLKIYSADNRFIGEIIEESDNLWFTRKTDDEVILTPWMKENFEDKYVRGLFVVNVENEDE